MGLCFFEESGESAVFDKCVMQTFAEHTGDFLGGFMQEKFSVELVVERAAEAVAR